LKKAFVTKGWFLKMIFNEFVYVKGRIILSLLDKVNIGVVSPLDKYTKGNVIVGHCK
jgi:hypothetical protein